MDSKNPEGLFPKLYIKSEFLNLSIIDSLGQRSLYCGRLHCAL